MIWELNDMESRKVEGGPLDRIFALRNEGIWDETKKDL